MPGAGKSSIGRALAAGCGATFIDTDHLIESRHKASLQQLLQQYGYAALREWEEQEIFALNVEAGKPCIIATGGSAVYSDGAMRKLRDITTLVYLHISPATMIARVQAGDEHQRGLARPENQSLEQLYAEREPLYRAAATQIIHCDDMDVQAITSKLLNEISKPAAK